ncbi:EF-hand domain-containing protein [Hoeflea sp.]|uniref:EF-hand domain-containing protein n=1 Tax=Hoeflea sp. TaxID=1940281 RepID=UPI003BB154AD
MKKTVVTALAAIMAASVALPALAAQDGGHHRGPRAERMIERFDANKDGAIERDELEAQRLAMFNEADTDQSGSLSEAEIKAMAEAHREERQQMRQEMRAERQQQRDERRAERGGERGGKMEEHAGKRHGNDGEGRGMGRHGGPRIERMDTDGNGEISAEEFAAMEGRMFERFDRNGDNKIDITDFYRNASTKD